MKTEAGFHGIQLPPLEDLLGERIGEPDEELINRAMKAAQDRKRQEFAGNGQCK